MYLLAANSAFAVTRDPSAFVRLQSAASHPEVVQDYLVPADQC